MLRLRKAQTDQMQQAMNERFVRRAVARLLLHYPMRLQGFEMIDLEHKALRAIHRADAIGIDDDRAVELFIALSIFVGEDFHEQQGYEDLMANKHYDWFHRMELVFAYYQSPQ